MSYTTEEVLSVETEPQLRDWPSSLPY